MIKPKSRVILDTNLLVSRALTPNSVTAGAVRLIIEHCHLLVSQDTMDELVLVLMRIQSKGYIKKDETLKLIHAYKELAEWIPIIERVEMCRDPKDDKFLELALSGHAEYLVTGDKDLLVLHPFLVTKILSAKDFIDVLLT